ncbi:hypothetical protein GCM10009678_94270 [Actinomadura kijaniata]|uniref:Ferric-dicitrate binding protein FerR (Iron transport regulator) n=1 Tax=Actinomadura namibiensis TaxID=182080 RepID=A0A7W3M023_ACTNM|nr:hypothetical protein [Actinomadura namibiensis]MBA8957496.1 ferric-dicitrate binding protein FerR (iron transport regulator) [Actinomadura namibiensis]
MNHHDSTPAPRPQTAPPSPARPAPGRHPVRRRWVAVVVLAAAIVLAAVWWAPADRAGVLVSLIGITVTAVIGWRNTPPRNHT